MADPLAYWRPIVQTTQTARMVIQITDPTIYDNDYALGQQWLNRNSGTAWILTGRQNGLATWEQFDNLTTELLDGELQIGSTGVPPVAANLTAGDNITIVNGPGSITISANNPLSPQNFEVITASQDLEPNKRYFVDALGPVTLTLPATIQAGYVIEVLGQGSLWTIAQRANQTIRFHSQNTTTGVSGSLEATSPYDCVTLNCVEDNLFFIAHPVTGNLDLN